MRLANTLATVLLTGAFGGERKPTPVQFLLKTPL